MVADGGLALVQLAAEPPDVPLALGEHGDDLEPGRVADLLEQDRRTLGSLESFSASFLALVAFVAAFASATVAFSASLLALVAFVAAFVTVVVFTVAILVSLTGFGTIGCRG